LHPAAAGGQCDAVLANVGIGPLFYVALLWPFVVLPVVVALEAWIYRYALARPFLPIVGLTAIANAVSAVVGTLLYWLFRGGFEALLPAWLAWFVAAYVLSVLIEAPILMRLRGEKRKALLWKLVWLANAASYVLLAAVFVLLNESGL
jgi:hypothetical protein